MGGSVGLPIGEIPAVVGGDVNIIPDRDLGTTYFGVSTNRGVGTPGVEVHAGCSGTTTVKGLKINIFNIGRYIYNKIMEW